MAPSLSAATASGISPCPEIMMVGRLIPISRISCSSSSPPLRGILRSERRMCGLKLLMSSNARTPSSAISPRNPHAASNSRHSSCVLTSSSAIKTRISLAMYLSRNSMAHFQVGTQKAHHAGFLHAITLSTLRVTWGLQGDAEKSYDRSPDARGARSCIARARGISVAAAAADSSAAQAYDQRNRTGQRYPLVVRGVWQRRAGHPGSWRPGEFGLLGIAGARPRPALPRDHSRQPRPRAQLTHRCSDRLRSDGVGGAGVDGLFAYPPGRADRME